jgi:prepilin-type N-terminal cleavage/methylation domain-containing protein
MSRSRAGFTLLELTLVLALIGILLSVVLPYSFDGMYGEVKVRGAADAFRSALVTARARAIDDGRTYTVAVANGTGHYRIAPDAAAFWNGAGDSSSSDQKPPLVSMGTLPGGIRFNSENDSDPTADSPQQPDIESVDPGQWSKVATFYPDGTAVDDVTVMFRLAGSRPLQLTLRALTGGVTVAPPDSASGQP